MKSYNFQGAVKAKVVEHASKSSAFGCQGRNARHKLSKIKLSYESQTEIAISVIFLQGLILFQQEVERPLR